MYADKNFNGLRVIIHSTDKNFMRMRRLFLLIFLYAFFFLPPQAAFAEKIIILKSLDVLPYNAAIKGFIDKSRVDAPVYDMEGNLDKGRSLAKEIIGEKPDLIVAVGTKASVILSETTSDIPIVSLMVSRPEKYLGNRPNVTSVAINPRPEDQFRILSRLYPRARRIGVIYNPENSGPEVQRGLEAVDELGYTIIEEKIDTEIGFPELLRKLRKKSDVLWLVMDETVITEHSIRHIIESSIKQSYPVIGFSKGIVKKGALFSSITNYATIGREGAKIALRIFDGAKPADIPFLYTKSSEYVLNLRTAKLLNLSIPEEVIRNAGEVYE